MSASPALPLPNVAPPAPELSGRAGDVLSRAAAGERISPEEGLLLFREAPLLALGSAAHARRLALHPPGVATFQVDRNINYTNVCVYRCSFCAFYRRPGDADGYVLPLPEIAAKVEETVSLGGTGVLLQGGVHAELPFSWYEELLAMLRDRFPAVHRHAFSAPEVWFLHKKDRVPVRDVLVRLRDAGLQSVPGGGAEILDDDVRRRVWALSKSPVEAWSAVHREAHRLGIPTTATMMFGVGESAEQRIGHLDVVRSLQDEALRGGRESFTAFIPWTFQEENTALDGAVETAGGFDYLRTLAVSRLYLDNVPHVQGSWVTQGTKIGQVSLHFGADDLGSIMIEENVVAAAGAHNRMTRGDMERTIRGAGFSPRQRGSVYERCSAPCCAALNA